MHAHPAAARGFQRPRPPDRPRAMGGRGVGWGGAPVLLTETVQSAITISDAGGVPPGLNTPPICELRRFLLLRKVPTHLGPQTAEAYPWLTKQYPSPRSESTPLGPQTAEAYLG